MLSMYNIIDKTKHTERLSIQEVSYLVKGYVDGTIPDYQMSAWLMAVCLNGLSKEETFYLTDCMKRSGEVLSWESVEGITADKHSTGGVGDKTTLIVAPIVASCGVKMPKMSGRGLGHTGGTIDKLESIPNFNVELSHTDFIKTINEVGCAIVSQSGNLTPADKKIYALRDVTATVDSIPLISSSIMSKKLALNSDCIVLDVKCGSGAFMKDIADATTLANLMVDIGKFYNKRCTALITDMNAPLGYNVGNSLEVIEAIETLKGNTRGNLLDLCVELSTEIVSTALNTDYVTVKDKVLDAISSGKALETFSKMIEYQGGNAKIVDDYSIFDVPRYSYEVKSKVSGYIQSIDSQEVGIASLNLGAGRHTKSDSIDYSAGIVFNHQLGDSISIGDTIATLYSSKVTDPSQVEDSLLKAITINAQKPIIKDIVISCIN
ncbi:MAG: thymidine phosphorylase [Ruminococcus sp.]|nr:thymidine phosphorylase [Ruminococcus sp.]